MDHGGAGRVQNGIGDQIELSSALDGVNIQVGRDGDAGRSSTLDQRWQKQLDSADTEWGGPGSAIMPVVAAQDQLILMPHGGAVFSRIAE